MTGLEVTGLEVTYPAAAQPALAAVSLAVGPAGSLALLGPSGSGKSTLLRAIAGLVRPDRGRVLLAGADVTDLPPERRGAVLMLQGGLLFPHLTLAENVAFGLRMRHRPAAEIAAKVGVLLDQMGLAGLADRHPNALSGGQAQRGALARALILDPRCLLLDEPFAALDPDLRAELRGLVRNLAEERGVTLVTVTHDFADATALARDAAVLIDGRLRQSGPAAQVYSQPADPEVARFLGHRTLITGQVGPDGFRAGALHLRVPASAPSGPAVLLIRPEAFRPGLTGPNAAPARILDRSDERGLRRLTLDFCGHRAEALLRPEEVPPTDPVLGLHLPPEALWVMPAPAGRP